MQPINNLDVWSEILRYFEISFAHDSKEVIQLKRRTILSVSLTSTTLSDIALDELWRSMESLEPIVHVLNASLNSPADVLRYHDADLDFWEISFSATGASRCFPRVLQYLSRIHSLHFATFPTHKDYALWVGLSNLDQLYPLCPNIQKIFLGPGIGNPQAVNALARLISPTLQSIVFSDTVSTGSGDAVISTFLNTLRCNGIQLLEVSYRGVTSSHIIQQICQFSTLRSITIQSSLHSGSLLGKDNVQFFRAPESLTKLDLYLNVFQADAPGNWIAHLRSLSTLRLSGSWNSIYWCINDNVCTSLQSLSLHPVPGTTICHGVMHDVFSCMSLAFPNLQSLCIGTGWGKRYGPVTLSDIMMLRERPMEILELHHVPVNLSTADVIDIFTAWPSLKRLSIIPSWGFGVACDANIFLSFLSNHAHKLYDLVLPFDFASLSVTPFLPPTKCVCPLQKLDLSLAQNLPQTLPEKLTLCRNLVSLLPKLVCLCGAEHSGSPDVVQDLQAIIRAMQDVVSLRPGKRA